MEVGYPDLPAPTTAKRVSGGCGRGISAVRCDCYREATMPEVSDSELTARRETHADRQRVWDVLADGWTYSQWVVGNSRMRAVDAAWPAPGSVIKHSVGIWPLVIDDETVAEACIPLEELVLLAKMGPAGAARISLRLHDTGNGTLIEMDEVPVRGPLGWLPKRAGLAMMWPRNRECLWRLTSLAERQVPGELQD
jgi:hypothetical protein